MCGYVCMYMHCDDTARIMMGCGNAKGKVKTTKESIYMQQHIHIYERVALYHLMAQKY